jgi:hypothetical protein
MKKSVVVPALLAVVALVGFACTSAHPSHMPDAQGNAAPIKDVASQAHAGQIALEPYDAVDHLYKNAKSKLPSSVRLAIMDTADWTAVWKRVVGDASTAPVPAVDFSREMLLVVGMGQAPCMGYQINIDTVFRDKDKRIYAVVRERHHGSRCGCLNEVVSPVDVVRVPRTVRPVTFLERRETNVCEERNDLQRH